jgi:flagellar hook-associated protein 1 FlgK
MGSAFGGINTALTSLYAQRRGLDVTGQNIANANTEGYTRQRVSLQAQSPSLNPGVYATTDQVGSGVSVSSVDRNRNAYLDERGRTEHANSAYLASQTSAYSSIEDVLSEPSDTALQARLHDMWDGWNDVANNWQVPATRTTLIQRSITVATTLNDAHASLSNQFEAGQKGLDTYVSTVNQLAGSIADMNNQIVIAKAAGLEANELQDQRDTQVLKLSELAGATADEQTNGAVNVYIGNAPLVAAFSTRTVKLSGPTTLAGMTSIDPVTQLAVTHPVSLQWTDTGTSAAAGGTMGAMLDTMNTIIPGIVGQLDAVANALATTVNGEVVKGYSMDGAGQALFAPQGWDGTGTAPAITAENIRVAITDPDKLAFSTTNPLDAATNPANLDPTRTAVNNGVADKLTDIGAAGTGADQQYQQMIGQLGVAAQAADRRSEIQDAVTGQVDTSKDAEAGVNLDEEMTHLLTYQRGYEAASRVLTTIDSMLDQLINRTGLVGR